MLLTLVNSPTAPVCNLQVPGIWELLGAAVVCATTMLLGWDEKRQLSKQQSQQTQQTVGDGSSSDDT